MDVLFKDPFHFCPPVKHKSVQVVDFLYFTDEFYLTAKAYPMCTKYRPSDYVKLKYIQVHPSFPPLFCRYLDHIPGWACHRKKKKKPQRNVAAFLCFGDEKLELSSMDFCFLWADSRLTVPCLGFTFSPIVFQISWQF